MYIVNEEQIPKTAISVNGVVAHYLMEEKKIPLLGKSEDKTKWYFADTFSLVMALENMPFWLKLVRHY